MKLYACITGTNSETLLKVANDYSTQIEILEDGILFDVSGLEKLIGDQDEIAGQIAKKVDAKCSIAVSRNAETAFLYAKNIKGITTGTNYDVGDLLISSLNLENDIEKVFYELGFTYVSDLQSISQDEFISRYGQEFKSVLSLIHHDGKHILTPNIRKNKVEWSFELEHAAEDFERLVFILASGLSEILTATEYEGFSTEQIDITLGLEDKTEKKYQVRISFPTTKKDFWRRIIDHKITEDLPKKPISSISLTCQFTKKRSVQFGLYSASKPEPESLFLTVNKIKQLVGESNVGVPVLLDQRIQKPYLIDSKTHPVGIKNIRSIEVAPQISFSFYEKPLLANVWISEGKLVYVKTKRFEGKVREYSGVWRESSFWWGDKWQTEEWDIEIEKQGVFRLMRDKNDWLISGEYD